MRPKKLLESKQNIPSSAVKKYLREKAKKSFVYGLLAGGAVSALVVPVLAQASIFSFTGLISETATQTRAAATPFNSQTMPLLSAAVNLDPHPAVGGGDITVQKGALVAQEGPSGTAADIDTRPSADSISVYTVRDGDSLAGIAKLYDVSVNTIVWANDIKGGVIHTGDQLIILPITGIKHTIVKGETLASLAKTYKSDAHEIAQYNNLADTDSLAVGDTVIIPNGEVAPAKTVTKKPATSSHSAAIKKIAKGGTEPYLGGSGEAIPGYFGWPVAGGVITQGLHGWNGVDIGASKGTSIYAAADGTVIIARSGGGWNGGYGNYVVIQHSNGTETLYAHASKVLVSVGQQVSRGQTIAQIGATGLATGPHLHFEVRGAENPFAN